MYSKISLENFTVFDELELSFSPGINVFIGENGAGKTHIMKIIYSASQATQKDVNFAYKLTKVFYPKDFELKRLGSNHRKEEVTKIRIDTEHNNLRLEFSQKTKSYEQAKTIGKEKWNDNEYALKSVFIPSKDILSNSRNLQAAVEKRNVDFDDTYLDLINACKVKLEIDDSKIYKDIVLELQSQMKGKVKLIDEEFYMMNGNKKMEFSLVAEGNRKLALLWQLLTNGTLQKGSILFWDEPEVNLNPKHIKLIVKMLVLLKDYGVQIFITTHDYMLSRTLELYCDTPSFHSFYEDNGVIKVESKDTFSDLEHNDIADTYSSLLDEIYFSEFGN